MADEQHTQEGDTGTGAQPWGDKTPEQIWADYQSATAATKAYQDALGGIDATQAKQGWDWARSVAQQIQEGKLRAIEEGEGQHQQVTPPQGPTDDLDLPINYDELSPREQALTITKLIADRNKAALAEMVKSEREQVNGQLQDWMGRTDQEKSLLFQVLEASRSNPKLDVKAALEQAARLKAASPDQLLQMAIERLSQPDPSASFDDRVSAKVAEKLQELENKRMEAAFGISGVKRKISLKKTPRTRDEVNRSIMQQWNKAGFSA